MLTLSIIIIYISVFIVVIFIHDTMDPNARGTFVCLYVFVQVEVLNLSCQ